MTPRVIALQVKERYFGVNLGTGALLWRPRFGCYVRLTGSAVSSTAGIPECQGWFCGISHRGDISPIASQLAIDIWAGWGVRLE